jgi:acyl carrier protein
MDRGELLLKLNDLIRDVFGEDDVVATDEMTADDVPGWDSTNHVRLIVSIEEAFHITFTTDEMLAPENVGELIDLIASKLKS